MRLPKILAELLDTFRRPKEIPLEKDMGQSLAHADHLFKIKAYHFFDKNRARFISKTFSYQCEDVIKYIDLMKTASECCKDIQISSIEFRISFMAYVDEITNMKFDSGDSVALKLQEGEKLLENFKYYIMVKAIHNK